MGGGGGGGGGGGEACSFINCFCLEMFSSPSQAGRLHSVLAAKMIFGFMTRTKSLRGKMMKSAEERRDACREQAEETPQQQQ